MNRKTASEWACWQEKVELLRNDSLRPIEAADACPHNLPPIGRFRVSPHG